MKGLDKLLEVRRISAWIEGLDDQAWRLEAESPFGLALAECTKRTRQSTEYAQKNVRTYKRSSRTITGETTKGFKNGPTSLPTFMPQRHRNVGSGPEQLGMPREVSEELLCSWAGISRAGSHSAEPDDSREQHSPDPGIHARKARDLSRLTSTALTEKTFRENRDVALRQSAAIYQQRHLPDLLKVWKENVAWSAGQALRLSPNPDVAENTWPALFEHWDVPLEGPEAPSDLLRYLRGFDDLEICEAEEGDSHPFQVRVAEPAEGTLPSFPTNDGGKKNPTHGDSRTNDAMNPGLASTVQSVRDKASFPSGADRVEASVGRGVVREILIGFSERKGQVEFGRPGALLSEELPQAILLPRAEIRSDRSASGAAAEDDSWPIDTAEEKELEEFSAKMRHVLNEEARRFGINV